MGFNNSGWMQVGADADLILLDMDKPQLVPRHDLAANVLYAARADDVAYVIVNGKALLRRGELTTLDEEKIKYHAAARGLDMTRRQQSQTQSYQG